MVVPNRFSLRTVRNDYWRSLRRYQSGRSDISTKLAIVGVPVVVFAVSILTDFVFPAPTALLSAVALLAGVLLAAAGQIVTMRARIADSLTLSTDKRVTSHVRETLSGVILAAVSALGAALLFGALAAATAQPSYEQRWWHVMLSSSSLAALSFVTVMFVATARRLYTTYLEVFEDGLGLPKPAANPRATKRESTGQA